MTKPEQRLAAILVGVGLTAVSTLSKLTAFLGLPGWLVASFAQRAISSFAGFWLIFYAANFIVWVIAAYLVVDLVDGRT